MKLTKRGKQIRRDTITLSKANGFYHYGGAFSAVEILIALYDHVLGDNDKFILSKGHAAPMYYVILRELGFNPTLESHPKRDPHNGIHCSTGSLGHGLPTAVGMAMAKKIKGEAGIIYVLMGDGECQEGTTWESMLIAAKHKLDNLVVIVDWNGIQGSGFVKDILPMDGLIGMATCAGWLATKSDGHNVTELKYCIQLERSNRKPFLIIADTIKGKGVSFMENIPKWHACWLNPEQEAQAFKELE